MSDLLPSLNSPLDLIANTIATGQPDYSLSPAARFARCGSQLTGGIVRVDVVFNVTSMVLPADKSRAMWWLNVNGLETFLIGGSSGLRITIGANPFPGGFLCTVDTHYSAAQDEVWAETPSGSQTFTFYVVKAML